MPWTNHPGLKAYCLDALLTLVASAASGLLVLLCLRAGWLDIFVAVRLKPYVILGGVFLLSLVALRVVSFVDSACLEDDDSASGARFDLQRIINDRGYDRGWMPVRYIVLLFPMVLYFFSPPIVYFPSAQAARVPIDEVKPADLRETASNSAMRIAIQGKMIRIQGFLIPQQDEFAFRLSPFQEASTTPWTDVLICRIRGIRADDIRATLKLLRGHRVEAIGCIEFERLSPEFLDLWAPVLVIEPSGGKVLGEFLKILPRSVNVES